jgi:hypothetical protein
MSIKVSFIVFLFSLTSCATKNSDMEMCFGNVQSRITDSVLKKIKNSPVDAYGDFASIISRAVNEESKSDSTCSIAINKFLLENDKNSITVNNLILFQQFQAYLKQERFNKSRARDIALKYEAKWK